MLQQNELIQRVWLKPNRNKMPAASGMPGIISDSVAQEFNIKNPCHLDPQCPAIWWISYD